MMIALFPVVAENVKTVKDQLNEEFGTNENAR